MDNSPSPDVKNKSVEPPKPEVLKPQVADNITASDVAAGLVVPKIPLRPRSYTHRPSHKATFIGAGLVIVFLAINIVVVIFFINNQNGGTGTTATGTTNKSEVTISADVLDTVGVSRSTVGSSGVELKINPNTSFGGTVNVGGDVSIAGQTKLNGKLTGVDATITKLDAGDTSLTQLNVNGDATISTVNLRKDLNVVGATRLQGLVTMTQLLTVNNNVNISGNVAVGGTLSVRAFEANSLISDTTLTVGGHFLTRGLGPSITPGSSLGSNGTVSIGGNDVAGTIAVNIGVGGGGGILGRVTFNSAYSSTPHVVVSAASSGVNGLYATRTSTGFVLGVNGSLAAGGYVFDYIVMQ